MKKIIPGLLLSLAIAVIATMLNQYVHLIGASVFALLLGMFINFFMKDTKKYKDGITFTSKKLLKVAIVLLGTSLIVSQIIHVGKYSLVVMVFTLAAAFGFGYLIGKIFNMNWKLSSLISAGTRVFAFRPSDYIEVIYKENDKMWKFSGVRMCLSALDGFQTHMIETTKEAEVFNRRLLDTF